MGSMKMPMPRHSTHRIASTAVNTGSKKERGALWYNVGRFVYVPLAVILCCVALFMHVAF